MASTTQSKQAVQERQPNALATTVPVRRKVRLNPFRIVVYTLLTLGAVIFIWPFLWMVSTSLQSTGDIVRGRFLPSEEFISFHETTQAQLTMTMGEYLEADALPSYLEEIRSQIESSQRQQSMTLHEYLRTQKIGFAELYIHIDLPLLNEVWTADQRYVVVGGAAHYIEAWDESNFSRYFTNSIKIAALTIIGQTFTSILAAYAFAKIEFPGRGLLFSLFLATIFIPTMVVLIPNRITVSNMHTFFTQDFPAKQDDWGITSARETIAEPLHDVVDALGLENTLGLGDALTVEGPISWPWMDNWPALVVPFLASTFSIFLLRQFFLQIPEELWDAARIDGAGHFRFLLQIVVPISRAAIITTILFTFIGTWNALEWPLLVTFTDNWRPISYGLYAFTTESGANLNLLMAASVITLVPVLVLYLFAQRQFTEGIATTGLKG
ncbi:carbohydrate ABC transporter permease [Aggregatilinea lenta]|uniref:carbohydrate ABC transporter permease n=1 Tax=Aggregatilinea lenta TaxID=913108 RepID=UPI001EE84204|nr:carbohydrate ABC transporter permease [Aggregatilinea lenta]